MIDIMSIRDSLLPEIPDRLRQSFGVSTAVHLFHKAAREVVAFNECDDYLRSADHAFNACLSIWHLVDWTFKNANEDDKERLAAQLGMEIVKQSDLAIAVQKACYANRICRVMATASKHVEVDKFPDETIQTYVNLYEQVIDGDERYLFRWAVSFEGDVIEASKMLADAISFWERLFREIGWIEGVLDPTL